MSFKNEVISASNFRRNPTREKWLEIIAELGEEGKELQEVLDDPEMSPIAIVRVVRERGYFVTRDMVYGWRRARTSNEY